jgi:hypothetical protein
VLARRSALQHAGVAPLVTPMWDDISRLRPGRIHPRPEAVASCCWGKEDCQIRAREKMKNDYIGKPLLLKGL